MPGNRVSSTASNRGGRRPLKSHHPSTQRPNMQSCAAAKRSRLQFVFELAQATFSQPGLPTAGQVEALRRTLSERPPPPAGALPRAKSC